MTDPVQPGATPPPEPAALRHRSPWRWLRRLIYLVLLLTFALAGMLAAVLGTGPGLRATLALADRAAPGAVVTQSVTGSLAGPLEIRGLAVLGDLVRIERVAFDWHPAALREGRLHVALLEVEGVRVVPPAAQPAPEPAPGSVALPALPEIRLPIAIAIDRLRIADVTVVQDGVPPLEELLLRGRADGSTATLDALRVRAPGVAVDASGAIGLAADAQTDLALAWSFAPAEGDALAGEGRIAGSRAALRVEHTLRGPVEAQLDATLEGRDLRLDRLHVLRSGTALAATAQGRLRLDDDRVRIEPLTIALLNGSVELGGEAGWAPQPHWDLAVTLDGIDPAVLAADWGGRIGGRLASRGRVAEGAPSAEVAIDAIEGTLRGYPVKLAAMLGLEGREARIDRLDFRSGEATLAASGRVGETLELGWTIDAPKLEQLAPGIAGALRGAGRIAGSATRPRVTAKLEGNALRAGESGVASLAVAADVGIDEQAPLRLDLAARGLRGGGKAVGDLSLDLDGTQAAHRLALALSGGELGLGAKLALAGGLREQATWAGKVEELTLRSAEAGEWRLARPAELALGDDLALKPLCLASGEARLCVAASRAADGAWQANLDLAKLPLALAQPQLPKDVTVAGAVSLDARASGNASGALAADATLTFPGARLTLPFGDQKKELDLSASRLAARIDRKGAGAELALQLGELASAQGRVDLPGWSPAANDPAKQRLEAKLKAQVPDLAFVRAFAPDLGAVAGRVTADLAAGGTLAAPKPTGQVALQGGRVEIPDAGLDIQDVQLTARLQGERIEYKGGARSGEGELRLTGFTQLDAAQNWPTQVEVKGRELTVIDTLDYVAVLSPDLRFRSGKDGMALEGELFVPRARLRPAKLPEGAVTPSGDVKVKRRDAPAEASKGGAALPLTLKVRLRLGDQVRFEALKLRGRLEGNLLVEQLPGRDPVGNGRLGVVDGVYTGLGKDLKIEKGWVNYASSPLDNPGLDMRAKNETADVTAGLTLTGTAKQPKVTLFSTPARPQAEILSYLLFGKPLGRSGSSEEKSSVADAAGVLGGNLLASQVGRQLGLEEFGVSGVGDKAALTVGQYVTPQLYLQYVSGLRSSINRLRIRYDLMKGLQLQTETGDQQAADLFYTFER